MNKWSRIKYHPNLPLGADGARVTASPAHIRLSRDAAREGMVLLKNENNALPLARGAKVRCSARAPSTTRRAAAAAET